MVSKPIDYRAYMVVAATTAKGGNTNHHYIHSLMFWDSEGPVEQNKKGAEGEYDEAFQEDGEEQ